MTHLDLAYIVIASVAATAAVLSPVFYLRQRALERQRDRAREQRDTARAEARRLRADRVHPFAEHAAKATALTEPTAYLPAWTSDGPVASGYVELRDAVRGVAS